MKRLGDVNDLYIIVYIILQFIRDKYDDCSRGVDQILKLKKDATFIKLQHDSSSLVHWEMTKMIAPEVCTFYRSNAFKKCFVYSVDW